jgi:NAD(P)-dependent dehydrogenase (short-subunit alcohol dehydrogenase family)
MTALRHARHVLDGQVIIVTGASGGMGHAIAIATARAGARVVLAARRHSALEGTRAAIVDAGGSAFVAPCDVTDPSAVDRLIETALDVSGRIDALVHAAGINIRERALDNLTVERWSSLLDTNLSSAFYLTHALVPIFRTQEGGVLLYIASSAAKKPDRSGVAYQASKAGLVGLAHGTMEEEREHGVRTTVIFPGLTDTPLVLTRPVPTPPEVLARALQPEDVAAACLFVLVLPPRAHVPELVLYPSRV